MSRPISTACDKWRDLIKQQRAGGLSVAAFCRDHGVAASSFFAWKRKLGATAAATPAFVEATVVAAGTLPPPGVAGSAGLIEVRLRGGRRVRVGRGFDRDLLAEVVAALEATR